MSNLTCAECECILTENSACEFYGNTYCSDCLEELTVCCERCGRRIYRGTNATGIAYNDGQRLCIYKRPLPAHKRRYSLPPQANFIMGHTRMTTQGDENFNQNNMAQAYAERGMTDDELVSFIYSNSAEIA